MLVAVGCGKTEVEKLEAENKKLEAELKEEKHKLDTAEKNKKLKEDLLKLSVGGSYEAKLAAAQFGREYTSKLVLLENGKFKTYLNGEKGFEATWELVEKEVYLLWSENSVGGYKIESNGDLTNYAAIEDGRRSAQTIGGQHTYKK